MQAKVLVEHRDMLGNCYEVFEAVGNRITLVNKLFNPVVRQSAVLVDFDISEVELLVAEKYVPVLRNQGLRDGTWIGHLKGKYYLKYVMPNGKRFINVCKNPYKTEEYKTISANQFINLYL